MVCLLRPPRVDHNFVTPEGAWLQRSSMTLQWALVATPAEERWHWPQPQTGPRNSILPYRTSEPDASPKRRRDGLSWRREKSSSFCEGKRTQSLSSKEPTLDPSTKWECTPNHGTKLVSRCLIYNQVDRRPQHCHDTDQQRATVLHGANPIHPQQSWSGRILFHMGARIDQRPIMRKAGIVACYWFILWFIAFTNAL